MTLVLDAGALIGLEWRNRTVLALLRHAQTTGTPVLTSAAAVAQAWRGAPRQALLARGLQGVDERPLTSVAARAIGILLAASNTADVVDAHVASLCRDGDVLLTSDPHDLDHLTDARGVAVVIERV